MICIAALAGMPDLDKLFGKLNPKNADFAFGYSKFHAACITYNKYGVSSQAFFLM
ncbi:MAG: hypothetical protein WCY21_07595 [Candidatus Cloacimonadaceae bacterium]|jgi:hypothetical protein